MKINTIWTYKSLTWVRRNHYKVNKMEKKYSSIEAFQTTKKKELKNIKHWILYVKLKRVDEKISRRRKSTSHVFILFPYCNSWLKLFMFISIYIHSATESTLTICTRDHLSLEVVLLFFHIYSSRCVLC